MLSSLIGVQMLPLYPSQDPQVDRYLGSLPWVIWLIPTGESIFDEHIVSIYRIQLMRFVPPSQFEFLRSCAVPSTVESNLLPASQDLGMSLMLLTICISFAAI